MSQCSNVKAYYSMTESLHLFCVFVVSCATRDLKVKISKVKVTWPHKACARNAP